MAAPRMGHLLAVIQVFGYLKAHHNSRLVHDPSYPKIYHSRFLEADWANFYGDIKEPIPHNAPESLGMPVNILIYVDADHAGDKLTQRSRTGFLIFINNSLISWYSKKQGSIEAASFGSEFMAMKTVSEAELYNIN